MSCCCNKNCRQGRDCPERIERVRRAKAELDRGERWLFLPVIRNLALALAVMLFIWVGSMVHDALRSVA